MSMDWFRSHHGAPTDSKWLLIAHRAKSKPGIVAALVWAMFDYASQHEQRGSTEGFDIETYAIYSGFDEDELHRILQALQDKEIIMDDRFTNWEKRQPDRERSEAPGSSTERVRRCRANKKMKQETGETLHETYGNNVTDETPVTPRNALDKTRQDQSYLNNLSLVAAREDEPLPDDLDFNDYHVCREDEPLPDGLDFNDYHVCFDVICGFLGKPSLSEPDRQALSAWHEVYDMRSVITAIRQEIIKRIRKKDKPANSLRFFEYVLKQIPPEKSPDLDRLFG